MPARVIVTLEPRVLHGAGPPAQTGHGLHGAIIRAVGAVDDALADQLDAPEQLKPLAVSTLADDLSFEVGVTGRHNDEESLVSTLAKALPEGGDLHLGHSSFLVTGCAVAERRSWIQLLEAAAPATRWIVRFRTPTSFRTRRGQGVRRNQPLPAVELVFGSLMQRWLAFSDTALPDKTAAAISQHLAVARLDNVRTQLHFIKAPEVGFVGDVTYVAVQPDRLATGQRRGISGLLDLGTFSGVGDRTTYGMGRIRVLPAQKGALPGRHRGRTQP